MTEEMRASIPETVLLGFERLIVQKGLVVSRLKADKAENFSEQKKMALERVEFLEYNSKEEVTTQGRADSAVLYTETENVEIFGNILFYSKEEETSIEAETLFWNKVEETLSANTDELVKVIQDDGSYMQGWGFQSDFKLKKIEFTKGASGLYIVEDDEESDE